MSDWTATRQRYLFSKCAYLKCFSENVSRKCRNHNWTMSKFQKNQDSNKSLFIRYTYNSSKFGTEMNDLAAMLVILLLPTSLEWEQSEWIIKVVVKTIYFYFIIKNISSTVASRQSKSVTKKTINLNNYMVEFCRQTNPDRQFINTPSDKHSV